MEHIISKSIEVTIVGLYCKADFFSFKFYSWLMLNIILRTSSLLMTVKPDETKLSLKSYLCAGLFCLYLIGGVAISFILEHQCTFLLLFISHSIITIFRYSPPFVYEKKGPGGLLRIFMDGLLSIVLHPLVLSDNFRFLVFEYLPLFLVCEAWNLLIEIKNAKEDLQNKNMTTGILIGKKGFCNIFLLIHCFVFIYLLLDLNFSVFKGLPLALFPWILYQVKYLKQMSLLSLQIHTFLYYTSFSFLTALGIIKSY